MAPSPIVYTNLHGGTHVRIFSHTFFKNKFFKIFWALSEGPRGSTPASSDPTPRATYPRIFSRLSNSSLTKSFTQALPTSNATPMTTPSSDPLLALRTLRFFPASLPHLSYMVLLRHSQPPPPFYANAIFESPPRVKQPTNFPRLSTSFLKGFTQALPTSTANPTPTPSSNPPPRVTYPTIFSATLLQFTHLLQMLLLRHPLPPSSLRQWSSRTSDPRSWYSWPHTTPA